MTTGTIIFLTLIAALVLVLNRRIRKRKSE